jgi:hypothetical protein
VGVSERLSEVVGGGQRGVGGVGIVRVVWEVGDGRETVVMSVERVVMEAKSEMECECVCVCLTVTGRSKRSQQELFVAMRATA